MHWLSLSILDNIVQQNCCILPVHVYAYMYTLTINGLACGYINV